jgi:hypothetical protein
MTRRTATLAACLGGAAILVTAVITVGIGAGAAAAPSNSGWVATWAASPLSGDTTQFSNQTVRNIIYTSVSGSEVQVRLSNSFDSLPVEIGTTSLGVVLDGAQLVPGTS